MHYLLIIAVTAIVTASLTWAVFEFYRVEEISKLSNRWRDYLCKMMEQNKNFLEKFKNDSDKLTELSEAAVLASVKVDIIQNLYYVGNNSSKEVKAVLLQLAQFTSDLTLKEKK